MDNLAALERHFGRPLDTFERVAADCHELWAVIMCNLDCTDFEIIDPCNVPLPAEITATLHARRMSYLGAVGLADGEYRSAFVATLPAATATVLAQAFAIFVARKLSTKGDSAAFLERLHSLPDPRTDN